MPEAEIIIKALPLQPEFLKKTDYPLGFFEKFAQALNIQMQFELTANNILVFFKTIADFEKILQMLSKVSVETDPNYVPSGDFSAWEFSVVKFARGENQTLLQKFSDGFHTFLGASGRVEMQGKKALVYMPVNFHIEKHLGIDFTRKPAKK